MKNEEQMIRELRLIGQTRAGMSDHETFFACARYFALIQFLQIPQNEQKVLERGLVVQTEGEGLAHSEFIPVVFSLVPVTVQYEPVRYVVDPEPVFRAFDALIAAEAEARL